MSTSIDSFTTRRTLSCEGRTHTYHALRALPGSRVEKLPFSLRILLENLLRTEDGVKVTQADIEALLNWDPKTPSTKEIAFSPSRVLLQDFTGVPCVVDLAVMRDAMSRMGGDPTRINPLVPVDLVIDHSVQVDRFGTTGAFLANASLEYERNGERYGFLRWGQKAFRNFRVVPPDTGIVHQVNLEFLATVAFQNDDLVYPDTLVGTDSHTTMINGLGVLGWGVGGIEAEAAMLGQPISMLIPEVVGFKLTGKLSPGATATDLVLTVTQMLRKRGVVGKFVEYYGSGLDSLTLADRATLANMAPEYGATMGFFPVDQETLKYLQFTGRDAKLVALVEAYYREQGLFRTADMPDPAYSDTLELDISQVEPSLAGPRRPQDRVALRDARKSFRQWASNLLDGEHDPGIKGNTLQHYLEGRPVQPSQLGALGRSVPLSANGANYPLTNGSVVIAAITSCTNTSNPSVMVAAGLLARNAVHRGLSVKPWVKTSLAPGSKVVSSYLAATGLTAYLEALRFHLVGYGCTTCIGNSGPLSDTITEAVRQGNLVVASVLSGNRNFEGRVNPLVKANYLASPPLVVAYALAGTLDIDLDSEPLGYDPDGDPVYLSDVWPAAAEVAQTMQSGLHSDMFHASYGDVFSGDKTWRELPIPDGDRYTWLGDSTYIKAAPYFDDMPARPAPVSDLSGARVLAVLGDSITTDHISPAGSIAKDSPAAQYLTEHGVSPKDFNSYGSRRGNHEVMIRGTFANVRLRNALVPGVEGPWTLHWPDGEKMTIFDAAMRYQGDKLPLVVLAGLEYGSGSSRDWAAKGPRLLGVRAVIARSFERIHRSNLIGMGVLPLQFRDGESVESLGLTGQEVLAIAGAADGLVPGKVMQVSAQSDSGTKTFEVVCRIDTPNEVDYFKHGGILQYVLRQLLQKDTVHASV